MRAVLLAALGLTERGLDRLSRATDRVLMRRFLRSHPEVTVYYPDGGRQ